MSVGSYEELRSHLGHKVRVVGYGANLENVACECETCNVVVIDFDKPADYVEFAVEES